MNIARDPRITVVRPIELKPEEWLPLHQLHLGGGRTFSGTIYLWPNAGNRNDFKTASVHISANLADLRIGGREKPGTIYLYPRRTDILNDSAPTAKMDAKEGIELGGNNIVGRLRLYYRDPAKLTAEVYAGNMTLGGAGIPGSIQVKDANGRLSIYLSGQDGGSIQVRDANGRVSIHLSGQDGDIILQNADCAEDFAIDEDDSIEPGTVLVVEEEDKLKQSEKAYDKKVAGVVSGAGDLKPGIVLGRNKSEEKRLPVALMGRVYCKVDAEKTPIDVGDLLTTSDTPGHAMKASDPLKAFGAVIGKALRGLKEGRGLLPILVALQ